MLSKRSNYSAYLIFKLSNSARGFRFPSQEVSVTIGAHVSKFSVCLMEEQESSRLRPILRRPRIMWNILHHANLPQEPQEDLREPHDPPVDAPDVPGDADEPQHDQWLNPHVHDPPVYAPDVPGDADEPQHDQWPDPHEQARRDRGTLRKPQTRQDGWMEILLGEFYNEEGDDGDVAMSLSEIKGGNWKNGLIVQGIEIRPKK